MVGLPLAGELLSDIVTAEGPWMFDSVGFRYSSGELSFSPGFAHAAVRVGLADSRSPTSLRGNPGGVGDGL